MTEKQGVTNDEFQEIVKDIFDCTPVGGFEPNDCDPMLNFYIEELRSLREKSTDDEFVRLFALEKLKNELLFCHKKTTTAQLDEMTETFLIFSVQMESLSGAQRLAALEHFAANSDYSWARNLLDGLKIQNRERAKNAVSNRSDQQMKQPFMDFCKKVIAEEKHRAIKTIHDLLSSNQEKLI